MDIGKKIKNARKKAGLTQKRLAEYCGLATGTIQQYELGKRQPRLEQLQKIANILNVPMYELVEFTAPTPDVGLQAEILIEEERHRLLLDIVRNMGYVVKFAGCPSQASLWTYDEDEKGFWTGDGFVTSCQFGESCGTCQRKEVEFYELSKDGKSSKIRITSMHAFFVMVEHDIDKLLKSMLKHGDE